MNYRHGYHAGNFADLHKHAALLALIDALRRKDKGFLYIDTHAGAGRYDLDAPEARQSGEAREGVGRFGGFSPQSPELQRLQSALSAVRGELDDPHAYPGSPLLAAGALRAQDRGACFESQPAECRALQRALAAYPRFKVECADGWQRLSAVLPAHERRALVLIDPPYEHGPADLAAALAALPLILARQANSVVALWYPVKNDDLIAPWLARLAGTLHAPTLCAEIWPMPRDSALGLNGSGLVLVNPPWKFAESLGVWQAELLAAIGRDVRGGCAQRWLVADGAA